MADETANLVLEHLRQIRAQISGLDGPISGLEQRMERGFSTLNEKIDLLETEVRGVSYVATVSIGSVLADIKDLKERVRRLEDA